MIKIIIRIPKVDVGITSTSAFPTYTGPTTVTPEFRTITVSTAGRNVTGDITVNPIPMTETDNPAGGKTLTIGG